ncbi:MAG: hypothetical protein MJZ88_03875 [Paludibacteraceae bacterium]|nr:hypothetical protein [Candidatus Colicola coprequi]MCQ2333737.1 hypothetical protein [Paludibacteraceae bacterium]
MLLSALTTLLTLLATSTLKSDISLTVAASATQPITYRGSFVMQGEKFNLSLSSYEAAYDGQTFYLYNEDADELTLSTPTQEELTEVNPLLAARAIMDACNITERTCEDGSMLTTLTPRNSGMDLQKLTLRQRDQLPTEIVMKQNNQTITLRLQNPQYTTDSTSFILHKEGAYINDMR